MKERGFSEAVLSAYQIDVFAGDKIVSEKKQKEGDITILSVSDYVHANGKNSYLNNGTYFFLLGTNEEGQNLYVDQDGSVQSCDNTEGYGIRPVFTLKENTTITGGNGTEKDPYIINQEETNRIYSYVKLGNDMWQVFEQKDNILKLVYYGYASINGAECIIPYSNTNSIYDVDDRNNIGYYLNRKYLSSLPYEDVLLPFDSYVGEISDDQGYQYENIFKNAVSTKVSLLNIFDPIVNNSLEDYFHINLTSEVGSMAYNIYTNGFLYESDVREEKHIVPVVSINMEILKSGKGTLEDPFVMEG